VAKRQPERDRCFLAHGNQAVVGKADLDIAWVALVGIGPRSTSSGRAELDSEPVFVHVLAHTTPQVRCACCAWKVNERQAGARRCVRYSE
jgi:hypothetical protein